MQLIGVDKLTEIKQESNEIYHGSLRKPAHRREVGGSWPVTHKVNSVCYSVPWLVRYRARLSDKDLCLSRFRSIPRHRISRGVNCPLLPCVYTPINARVQFSEKRAGKLFLPVEVFVLLASLFLKVCNCEISNFVASLFCVRVSGCLRRNSLGVYIVLIAKKVWHVCMCIRFANSMALRMDHRYFDPRRYICIPAKVSDLCDTLYTRGAIYLRTVKTNTNCSLYFENFKFYRFHYCPCDSIIRYLIRYVDRYFYILWQYPCARLRESNKSETNAYRRSVSNCVLH